MAKTDRAGYREDEIKASFVGEVPVLDSTVTLHEHDPAWPGLYEREAERIRGLLGDRVVLLEQVGSTSVPGLCAKPVIDVLLVVPDSGDEQSYLPALERAGYRLVIREPQWHEHRCFKGPDTNINPHVLSPGCDEIDRYLTLRNHLRRNESDRALYANTKRELASRTWKHIQNYADAKSPVIDDILAHARSSA
ncbi:MAG TPA: GrpB family protein [Amycolatopsis sp.]|uniref:GrpB family protein n=1 Tax=Amycolatopsis sp. TaxID=37632 RepID=UPI002B4A988F|nr:GrpB family protein [Amycolatopsis sp.]HKS46813.1 GrpB family protein [Amycolatopsis sp.]